MLTYHVFQNSHRVKIYAYRRAIFDATVPEPEQFAIDMIDALNAGNAIAAIDCAWWVVAHDDKLHTHVNRSLGPNFYLRVDDLTICDMSGNVVAVLLPGHRDLGRALHARAIELVEGDAR